jgi:hypothetical protein
MTEQASKFPWRLLSASCILPMSNNAIFTGILQKYCPINATVFLKQEARMNAPAAQSALAAP